MGYTLGSYEEATKMARRWGNNFGSLHIYRCEIEGLYWIMKSTNNIKKMESYADYLAKLEHPIAYLIAADCWEHLAGDFGASEKNKYCKEKAMECVRKSIERKEDGINFYCVKYLAENGKKDEAIKVCEEIVKNRGHKNYDQAKKYLKWEKKRNSFLGKFDVGLHKFWDKPGLHLLYLGISCLLCICFIGFPLLGIYVVKKINLSKHVSITWEQFSMDDRIMKIKYDKIFDSVPMKIELVIEEEDRIDLGGNLLGNVVGMIRDVEDIVNPVSKQRQRYIKDIERIMDESPVMREKKYITLLERAKTGDKVALAALEFFYGVFYEDGAFVEKEPVSRVTAQSVGLTLHC